MYEEAYEVSHQTHSHYDSILYTHHDPNNEQSWSNYYNEISHIQHNGGTEEMKYDAQGNNLANEDWSLGSSALICWSESTVMCLTSLRS